MSDLRVVLATTEQERSAGFELRRRVFVEEQGVPAEIELDERDADAEHFLALVEGMVAAAGRLVVEPPGYAGLDPALGPVAHLGRLAVDRARRGSGLGALLVRTMVQRARERGLAVAYLGAQTHAVAFYEGLGFAVFGEPFDDAGLPHRHMVHRWPARGETARGETGRV